MNRVIVENNTKQNIYSIFESLQDNLELELKRLYADLFQEFGVVAATINGAIDPTDTALKITQAAGIGNVLVNPGHGILPTGDILRVISPGENFTISGEGTHSLYLIAKDIYTEFVERVAGFQYGAGTSTVPSRVATSINLTETDPGISGILLADVVLDAGDNITSIDDRRDENVLKFNLDLYDELDVVRLNSNSVISGTLQAQVLQVKDSDSAAVLTISGTLGGDLDATVTPSGIVDAVNYAHDHGASTFDPRDVTSTATAVNNLMSYGIINYNNGDGDQIIQTERIPSAPNTISGINASLYIFQQGTSFGTSLLSDLATYRANQISISAQTNKRNNLSNLSSQITAWFVLNSGLNWLDAWTSADVVDAYGHTLSGLAQTIVDYGYATVDEVGFNGPDVGTNVSDLRDHINSYRDLSENERATLSSVVSSVAENIAVQAERINARPDLVRPQAKVKVTWSSPTLVDNEEIKKYVVRVFKLADGDWDPVPSHANMISLEENVEATLGLKNYETISAQRVLSTVATVGVSSGSGLSYEMSSVAGIQVNDYVLREDDATDKSQVLSINGVTNYITLKKLFEEDPDPGENLVFYRATLEDTEAQRTQWINIDRDEYYVIYVRAVSEYDIYGPWSDGYLFITNSMSYAGDTLLDIMNSRDAITSQVAQAQQVKLRTDLEETISSLSNQVAAQPDYVAVNNLTTAYKNLQDQVNAL